MPNQTFSREEYNLGFQKEKVHETTYKWLLETFKKNGKVPRYEEFILHLVQDNLCEDKNFYKPIPLVLADSLSPKVPSPKSFFQRH